MFDLNQARADKLPETAIIQHLQGLHPELDIASAARDHGLDAIVASLNGQEGPSMADRAKSYFSPDQIASRGVQGAVDAVPGVGSFKAMRSPDASGPDKAGAVAGDVANAATAVATGGTSLIAGPAINAGLEATGINPAFRAAAAKTENIYADGQSGDMVRNPNPTGPKFITVGGGVPTNMLFNLPKTALSAGVSALPSILASKGLTKATGGAETPAATQLLEKQGGQPPASAYTNSKILGAVGRGIERGARTNPLTEGIVEPMDSANIQAVKGYVGKNVPHAEDMTGARGGEALKAVVQKSYDAAKDQYQAVLDQVKNQPWISTKGNKTLTSEPPGNLASTRLNEILKTDGFIPDEAKALIQDTAKRIKKNGTTAGNYDNEIKRFNYENQKMLAAHNDSPGTQGTLQHFFSLANDALKKTHYESLNEMLPGLGDKLQATNFDYAQMKGSLFGPFAKMAGGKVEDLPKKMLTAGTEFRDSAKAYFDPTGYKTLQNEALAEMFRQATDAQGNLNAQSLQNLYGKKYKGMDWTPQQKAVVENTIGMMKKAGLGSLSAENPSGTAGSASKIAHTTALLSGVGTAPALAASAGEAAYFKLPQAYRAAQKVGNAPIPATPTLPVNAADLANVARMGNQARIGTLRQTLLDKLTKGGKGNGR